MSYRDYKQYDYSGYTYCGGSFASQGCGPTSVADIVEISPITVAQWMTNNGYATTDGHGTYWGGINAALTAFNAGGKMIAESMDGYTTAPAFDTWKGAIQSGCMGVLLMHNVTNSYWTTSGHYIAVVQYDAKTDRYYVCDPASVARTGWHPWSDFVGNICCLYTSTKRWGDGPSDTTYTFTLPQVQEGDKNKYVLLAQKMLKSRGLYTGKLDKSFGPKMKKAVLDYQKIINKQGGKLAEDGVIGPATWQSLFGLNGKVDGAKVTLTVDQVKAGSKNVYVYDAQQILKGTGYYLGELDMSYGPATVAAVKAFQKDQGITRDGVCGPTTFKKLIAI